MGWAGSKQRVSYFKKGRFRCLSSIQGHYPSADDLRELRRCLLPCRLLALEQAEGAAREDAELARLSTILREEAAQIGGPE